MLAMLFWVVAALAVASALAVVWGLYLLVRRWLPQRASRVAAGQRSPWCLTSGCAVPADNARGLPLVVLRRELGCPREQVDGKEYDRPYGGHEDGPDVKPGGPG